MLSRISLDSAGPRDAASLSSLPRPASPTSMPVCNRLAAPRWLVCASAARSACTTCGKSCSGRCLPEPPVNLTDGGAIAAGVDPELDELRSLGANARQSITTIEERERKRTGIHSLKVRFNNVFGYSIEVTRSNLALVPADYERKQTLANAERFTTPELKQYEVSVLSAHERSIEIEKRIFSRAAARPSSRPQAAFASVQRSDCRGATCWLTSLTWRRCAITCAPSLRRRAVLETVSARHPVVECLLDAVGQTKFVANDLYVETGWSQPAADHRAKYGRQIHLSASGRPVGHHGADGLFRSRQKHAPGHCGPHLHPHWRQRQRGPRPFHLHGRNDRDRHHSQHRDAGSRSSCWTKWAAERLPSMDSPWLGQRLNICMPRSAREPSSLPTTMSSLCWRSSCPD